MRGWVNVPHKNQDASLGRGVFVIKRWKTLFCLLLLQLTLGGCSSHSPPVGKLGEKSRDDFMASLRWKRFGVAASQMQEEYRENFKQTFARLPQIHITDVRLLDLLPEADGRRFTATIEMDYYNPPSMTVKTFRFDQTWVYFDAKNAAQQGFLITTPFPPFP